MADGTINRRLVVVLAAFALVAASFCLVDASGIVIGGLCTGSAATPTCPSPGPLPVASLNLTAYQGRWFEIGSTATFKLFTESGFSCIQARYSPLNETEVAASNGATIRVRNSGVPFLGSGVRRPAIGLAISTNGLCRSLKKWCGVGSLQALQSIKNAAYGLGGDSQYGWYGGFWGGFFNFWHSWDPQYSARSQIRATILQRANSLFSALSLIETLSQSISESISAFQFEVTSIAQGSGGDPNTARSELSSIHAAVNEIKDTLSLVSAASEDITESVQDGRNAPYVSQADIDAYSEIEKGNTVIGRLVGDATEIVQNITAALRQTQGTFEGLASAASVPINTSAVPSVALAVAGSDPSSNLEGQLQVTFPFTGTAPYWVIAIEGKAEEGYTAALVYSCQSEQVPGQGTNSGEPTLFILSRTPSLDPDIIIKFFAFAEHNGVVLSCSNPFIFTPLSQDLCAAYF